MAQRNRKVVRYRKPIHIDLGVVVFFIIFVYIVIISINYFRQERISIYEVVEKNISDDNTYKGIILRDETIYYTDKAGYINYYIGDGEKTAKKSIVYTIDETGELYKVLSNADTGNTLSGEDSAKLRNSIAAFRKNYQESSYQTVTDFKYDIENTLLEQSTQSMMSDLKELSASKQKSSFETVAAKKSGIITYTMDGMEDLKTADITAETFKEPKEKRKQLRSNESLKKGSPVYKMINSENWNIIIPLSDTQYQKLKDLDEVKITFKKDNISTTAGITTYENTGNHFANLDLKNYMIRYLNERYIDLEIALNAADGLKIPVTSILTKDFWIVPNAYISVGGKANVNGVTKEYTNDKGETQYEFIEVNVITKNDSESYVEADKLLEGNSIINPETNERYQIGKKGTLSGVYNVNKGYAVFRIIEKIYENKEYVIVSKDTPYGLSIYDNIVVNAASIEDSALVKK